MERSVPLTIRQVVVPGGWGVVLLLLWSCAGCSGKSVSADPACDPGDPDACAEGLTCLWSDADGGYRCVADPAGCGNGQLEVGEACDGLDLGGQSCESLGYLSGPLACAADCTLDTIDCAAPEDCNNGVLDPGEDCDGPNLGGLTCEDLGMGGGSLGCSPVCRFEPGGCDNPPVCGNGQVDYGEACDDGNTVGCDGCSPVCQPDGCGNGIVDCGEACDDGNTSGGDGCAADCASDETCGNGVTDAASGEVCDDGNNVDGDGCAADCSSDETCGNGTVDAAVGEVCDDGNGVDGDGCAASCLSDETCGNGVTDAVAGEVCDDGNGVDGDGCAADCSSDETCGNGVVDAAVGEQCDDGNNLDGDGCQANCALPGCGDGVLDTGEVCDDGNNVDGDGCSATCMSNETCGNGIVDVAVGETCDDGGTSPCDGCSMMCRTEGCGNGVQECFEACDDGNTVAGDGCAADCSSNETCGNGVVDGVTGEVCDDGAANSNAPNASCRMDCQPQRCGDQIIDNLAGEQCDDGNVVTGDGCGLTCLLEVCGNGVVDPGEQCDDGNLVSGDGCSGTCVSECGIPCVGPTIQDCIDNAAAGDVIAVGPAAVSENVVVAGKEITLKGDCSGALTVWTCANTQDRAIRAQAGADLTVEGFVFEYCNGGTSAAYNSGVVLGQGADAVRLRNNIFRYNTSHRGSVLGTYGGSVFPTNGYVLFENNIMHDNQADDGGVIYISGETYIDIINNLVYDNGATDYCGAIWLRNQVQAKMIFRKNVVYGHWAGRNPALEVYSGQGALINSSIVTSNSPSNISSDWPTTYSMIGGNPLFTNPAGGDFSLGAGSPAIDAGDPALPNDPDASRTDQGCALHLLPVE